MAEPKVLISKKSIKTMGKDMMRIKRGELDVEDKKNKERKSLAEEIETRRKEEERLRALQEQGKKIVEKARDEKKEEPAIVKAVENRQKEAEKLAALQEARKKAEQEREKEKTEKKETEKKPVVVPLKRDFSIAKEKMSKEDFSTERKKIESEKDNIKKELAVLAESKKPLELKKKDILEDINAIELSFQDSKAQEEGLWQKLSAIEKKEAEAKDPKERRFFEKKRWRLEKEREEIEKKRWPEDEKLEQLEAKLKGLEREGRELQAKEQELNNKLKEISKKEQGINLNLERINSEEALKEIEESRALLEDKVNVLFKNNEEASGNLTVISAEEKKVEQEKKEIEGKERAAEDVSKRRELEKTRWQIEERRRNVESKRWKLEEEKEKISQDLKDSQNRLKAVLDKKEKINKRLEEIKTLLGEKPTSVLEKPKPPEKIEPEKPKSRDEILKEVEEERVARIEEARKRIDTLKRAALERKQRQEQMKKAVLPPMARQKLEPGHEKPEPVKEERRADIMKRLRTPALIYQKLNNIKKKEAAAEQSKVQDLEEIIRVVPKKPSFREKLWVRALVVAATLVILAGILTFWYWYFRIRTEGPIYPAGYEKEREGIVIPSALFNIPDSTIITVSNAEDLTESLEKTLQAVQPAKQFKRIIIKKEGEIVGVRELFNMLGVVVPDNFYDNIVDEPTMFVFFQGQGGRFGLVVKTSTSAKDLNIVLKSMEPTAEADFENLFVLMGKEGKAVAPYFKNATDIPDYVGPDFRFKTLNQNDLGIFYAVNDYYFAFSSSSESMQGLLAEVQNFLEKRVLLNDLKFGDNGEQVSLLQKWLAGNLNIENPAFVSGVFNEETRLYVINFQEKYAADILIPQGRTKGTGIVDLTTRKKLNQLYADF